jgi:hypothetical protein
MRVTAAVLQDPRRLRRRGGRTRGSRAQGRLLFDRLVTALPLERINDAFAAAHDGAVVGPVLSMP